MNKRKKLVKLFLDIKDFIAEKGITASPHGFLLNKLYLTVNAKRASAETLKGISKEDFALISKNFENRLKKDLISSLSISYIFSLPSKNAIEINMPHNKDAASKPSLLFLSDALYLPYEREKDSILYFSYHEEKDIQSPFQNATLYPISRMEPVTISLQATLFDVIDNATNNIKPFEFDMIADESVFSESLPESFLDNMPFLLSNDGCFIFTARKNFLVSPSTKKEKKNLYKNFFLSEIVKDKNTVTLKLMKKSSRQALSETVNISDGGISAPLTVHNSNLEFNNLLTFNDNLSAKEIALLEKIENRAEKATCGKFFKFFIGMFPEKGRPPEIEKLRRTPRFKPFIKSKDIIPFSSPATSKWILPDKESFYQIPPPENFDSEKLLLRYLSVRPIFCYDNVGLYFLNDVAAVMPNDEDILLEYAEGYLNSNIILFYYTLKFPHHNKFLKKNFNTIPFFKCGLNIQKIIQESVMKTRAIYNDHSLEKQKHSEALEAEKMQLNKYIYQLFKLTAEEISIVEHKIEKYIK